MNCEQAEELLSAYLDDALEPGLSEQVRAHLETCEHCREVLEDYRRLDAELATAPMVAPDDSLRDRLFSSDEYKALLREQQEAADAPTEKSRRVLAALHPNSPLWSKALLPIAAAVALALLLTVLARQGVLPFFSTASHPVATTVPFSGPGQNGAPLAAGPRAVYLHDGRLWSAPEQGPGLAQPLTPDGVTVGAWAVSPLNGASGAARVAYVDTKTNALHLIRSDGQSDKALDAKASGGLSWSPDGVRLAYYAPGDNGASVLHIMNADGSGDRVIGADSSTIAAPVWNADGSWLAWTQTPQNAQSIWSYKVADNSSHQLAASADSQDAQATVARLAWLPGALQSTVTWSTIHNGAITGLFSASATGAAPAQRLTPASATYGAADYTAARSVGVWLVASGKDLFEVLATTPGLTPVASASGIVTAITWSPAGNVATIMTVGQLAIWSPGRGLTSIENAQTSVVTWSADGQSLAYAIADGAKMVKIIGGVVSTPRLISDAPKITTLSWAPDGKSVALATESGVIIATSDGATQKQVDDARASEGRLSWSIAG
ncbi:MAG TPA: zf-HC2 domain-containing protein [Ktedonobacterales bacterium]|jgi:anti-sigma factor RsiW|nr:zf-HC2 domain-containing protein [Ktedonobacterales bacterium]